MIKLKQLLESADESSANLYSWLSPSGQFFPVKYPDMHSDVLVKLGFKSDWTTTIEKVAAKAGYMRINHDTYGIWVENKFQKPNDKQMAALKDLAMENHKSKIIWDKGVRDTHILWSSYDTME
jgi:hypothetical protein